jgi:hypothetical protein
MHSVVRAIVAIAAVLVVAVPVANADPITLTFEGISGAVGDFYAGGGGGRFGIQFSSAALAVVDLDAGGGGFFANEPSPDTVLNLGRSQPEGGVPTMNVRSGFRAPFGFYYTQPFIEGSDTVFSHFEVAVFSGLDGQGRELGRWALASTNPFAAGDPTGGLFGEFVPFTATFRGIARSVTWTEPRNLDGAAFDNIVVDPLPAPEPATLWLVGAGAAALFGYRRRSHRRAS